MILFDVVFANSASSYYLANSVFKRALVEYSEWALNWKLRLAPLNNYWVHWRRQIKISRNISAIFKDSHVLNFLSSNACYQRRVNWREGTYLPQNWYFDIFLLRNLNGVMDQFLALFCIRQKWMKFNKFFKILNFIWDLKKFVEMTVITLA